MDFVAVPAGTMPAAALTLRGPDHEVDLAAADDFVTVLGTALAARVAVGGRKRMDYSSVSGMLSGHLFTRDPAVLQAPLHGSVAAPAKLRALWLQLIADGLPANVAMTRSAFLDASGHLAC